MCQQEDYLSSRAYPFHFIWSLTSYQQVELTLLTRSSFYLSCSSILNISLLLDSTSIQNLLVFTMVLPHFLRLDSLWNRIPWLNASLFSQAFKFSRGCLMWYCLNYLYYKDYVSYHAWLVRRHILVQFLFASFLSIDNRSKLSNYAYYFEYK